MSMSALIFANLFQRHSTQVSAPKTLPVASKQGDKSTMNEVVKALLAAIEYSQYKNVPFAIVHFNLEKFETSNKVV